MKKDLFLYNFLSILVGVGYFSQIWCIGLPFVGFGGSILYFFICAFLGMNHFVPKLKSISSPSLLSKFLGAIWFSLSFFFVLAIGSNIAYYLRRSVFGVGRMETFAIFPYYFAVPFSLICFLLFIFISVSLILKNPFWLGVRKGKYLPLLGILIGLSTIGGGILQYSTISGEIKSINNIKTAYIKYPRNEEKRALYMLKNAVEELHQHWIFFNPKGKDK